MTACACPMCAANRDLWNAAADRIASGAPRSYDPVASLDGDTLERSFSRFSKSARREQRRPRSLGLDELGYAASGAWVPAADPWREAS